MNYPQETQTIEPRHRNGMLCITVTFICILGGLIKLQVRVNRLSFYTISRPRPPRRLFEMYIINQSEMHYALHTGVTQLKATRNEVKTMTAVNASLRMRYFVKSHLNSSIRPVITHSRPPICKQSIPLTFKRGIKLGVILCQIS